MVRPAVTGRDPATRALRRELECLEAREVPATIVGVTLEGVLERFDTATPAALTTIGAVTGLTAGDAVVGLAFRPATAGLYAVGYAQSATAQLYTVDPTTAGATPIGSRFGTGAQSSATFGVSVDPVSDQVRVAVIVPGTPDTEKDFRLDPTTGAVAGTDADIRPPEVTALAHLNPFGTTTTTLYGYDAVQNALVTVDPATGRVTMVGATGLSPVSASLVGLTIAGDGAAYLVAGHVNPTTPGGSTNSALYAVTLGSGTIALIGNLDPAADLTAIAIAPAARFLAAGLHTGFVTNVPDEVDVFAVDAYGKSVPGYQGNLTFTSTDPAAFLPTDTFLARGVGGFDVTFNTPGDQVLTATDTRLAFLSGSAAVRVSARFTPPVPPPPPGPRSVSVAFGPFGKVLELVTQDGALIQFDAAGVHALGGGMKAASVAFGPTGEVLELVTQDGALIQFDAAGVHALGFGILSASVAFGPTGEELEVVTDAGLLYQFDALAARLLGRGVRAASVAFPPSGEELEVVTDGGSLYRFDAAGSHFLLNGVRTVSAAYNTLRGEVFEVILDDGALYQSDNSGAHRLA